MLGNNLLKSIENSKCYHTYLTHPTPGGIYFDCLKHKLTDIDCNLIEVENAIILLGQTDPIKCFNNPEFSEELNCGSIIRILKELKEYSIKPIFTSTEYVFDGLTGNYSEDATANPTLLYGKQKLTIENFIKENFDNFLIFRLAKMFGDFSDPRDSIFTSWIKALVEQTSITCTTDQVFSPVNLSDVCQIISLAINSNLKGLFHLGGKETWNRYDLLLKTSSILQKYFHSNSEIRTKGINEFNLPETYPLNVSLNSSKIYHELNFEPQQIEKYIKLIVKQYIKNIDAK